jgi:hypothetical protein
MAFSHNIEDDDFYYALNNFLHWFEIDGVDELILSIARDKNAIKSLRDVDASDLKKHNFNIHQKILNGSENSGENQTYFNPKFKNSGGELLSSQIDGSDFQLNWEGLVKTIGETKFFSPSMNLNGTGNQVSLDVDLEVLLGSCARTMSIMSNGCGMGSATMVSCYDRENEGIRKEKKKNKAKLKEVKKEAADVGTQIAAYLKEL